ncbi:YugN family protein [Halobacillus salinarum]|uniref:YugN family protein n=1 Tax=Halobacillus salinarum TaxID=2932257 RepID=UPI002961F90B|nr:YugN family protein [Halobacillus salinarum]
MKLEGTGLEGLVIDQKPLTKFMESNGFILGGSWDYERVTYDYKMDAPEKNITHYIRIQGFAIEGDVDQGNAVIQLLPPLLGRHYYPHGIEYGEEEGFPENIVEKAKNKVMKVQEMALNYVTEVPDHVVLERLTAWAKEQGNQDVLDKVEELTKDSHWKK